MEARTAGIISIIFTLALVNEMSINVYARDNPKRRPKEKTSGALQKNICDITDRDSKVHCYCENTREPRNATKAECWVFNGGIPRDDLIWHSFASQPTLQTLSFNVRVDGALGYVPTRALHYLQRLRSLNIKYGSIVEVNPYAFANLSSLKEATLAQNQIETLQQFAIAHLTNLTFISFEDNSISEIPLDAFTDLPNLQKLILTKNNISTIQNGAFQHVVNLLELDLNKNSISILNRRTFDGLANLKRLDLRKNRIYNLNDFTFAELWNLQELLLGRNDLKIISERAFDGLSQLKKLSLDDNKLTSLTPGLFEGVRGLSSLDLRSNELYALSFDNIKPILDNLKSQTSNLYVDDNNFACNCRLTWMHALRNETKSQNTRTSLDAVTCTMDPPVVSSAYSNTDGAAYDTHKYDPNEHDTVKLGNDITINVKPIDKTATRLDLDTKKGKEIFIDRKNNTEDITKKPTIVTEPTVDNNMPQDTIRKGVKRNVLTMPPDSLPCPRETRKTTDIPFVLDPVIPVQKEMKIFQDDVSSANSIYYFRSEAFIIWIFCHWKRLFLR